MGKLLVVAAFVWRMFYRFHFYCVLKFFEAINVFIPRRSVGKIHDEILLQSAVSLAKKIRSRELTSVQVVEAYIRRCREVNGLINAVVEENYENALEEAKRIDQLIEEGNANSVDKAPFLGVPFAVKDHMFVHGMLCTAGIYKRKNIRMFEDADVVWQMKQAGAIVLCTTNTSEVCMWYESYNAVYGRTENPYDTRRTAGGSSGGQGSLIGAAGVPFGIGSDIGGSIRMPAYFNGIFGHKPSQNIISQKGVHPAAKGKQMNMYCIGPMCRYAEDLLPMTKILAGSEVDKMFLDSQVDFTKLKIFYMTEIDNCTASPLQSELVQSISEVTKYFYSKYGAISYKLDLENVHWALAIWFNEMEAPDTPSFSEEMCNLDGDMSPALELIFWIFGRSKHTYPALGLAFFEKYLKKMGTAGEKAHVSQMLEFLKHQFNGLMDDNTIFLFPPHPNPAPFHYQPCFTPLNFQYTALFNALGLPATCCPLGLSTDHQFPTRAVQVVAGHGKDHLSLAVACELERAFGGWRQPQP